MDGSMVRTVLAACSENDRVYKKDINIFDIRGMPDRKEGAFELPLES